MVVSMMPLKCVEVHVGMGDWRFEDGRLTRRRKSND